MRQLVLYRFRYFDPLRRRWLRARYVLEAPAIRCHYPDYELIGTPEIRHVGDEQSVQFNPFSEMVRQLDMRPRKA
jgi:hypothetical protein